MGFRNPATTAEGVDTGPSTTGPGVRLYQDTTGPLGYPRGVLEFRDGIGGDAHATLTRTVYAVDAGAGLVTSTGAEFALSAGSANGTPGGGLVLAVVPDPLGGYMSKATLTGDTVVLSNPATAGAQGTTPSSLARKDYVDGKTADSGWLLAPLLNSFTGSVRYRTIGSDCFVVVNVGHAAWSGFLSAAQLPAAYRPTVSIPGAGVYASTLMETNVNSDGNVVIRGTQAGSTASFSYPLG
jgi:hypothetical protein